MKRIIILIAIIIYGGLTMHGVGQMIPNLSTLSIPKGNRVVGMFDGRTPCLELAAQLHVAKTAECIKIKWRLFLFKDSVTGRPTTFALYGVNLPRNEARTGQWHTITGTPSNKEAVVYRLDLKDAGPILLLKADDNILFFLDPQKNIMVGNRDFSYTLNRVEKKM